VKYVVSQDRESIVGMRETVVVHGEPYIVADIEAAETDWFLSRLNGSGQMELLPSRVTVTLERFDGYDGGKP
jgi:hypothetical protein